MNKYFLKKLTEENSLSDGEALLSPPLLHIKGDETINYTLFLLVTSVMFQGLIWTTVKAFDWKAAFLATIANYILPFILGFGVLMVSGLSEIPRHLIFLWWLLPDILQHCDRLAIK